MSNALCISDDCQQALLYETNNDTLTPFIRYFCIDKNGVATTFDFELSGQERIVLGLVVANPATSSACCHSVALYDHVSACVSTQFIRQYSRREGGGLEFADYTLANEPYTPSGLVRTEPSKRNISKEIFCDVVNNEVFNRWYVACDSKILNIYDTKLDGVEHVASDVVYAGKCLCKPVTLRRELCDVIVDSSISPLTTLKASVRSWTLPNNVTVTNDRGAWALYHYQAIYESVVNSFNFSQPVDVDFGLASILVYEKQCRVSDGLEPYWIDDRVAEWNNETRIVKMRPANHFSIAHPSADRKINVPMPSYIKFRGKNIMTMNFEGVSEMSTGTGNSTAGLTYLTVDVVSNVKFFRSVNYDSSGAVVGTSDRLPDGADYVVMGIASDCSVDM